MMRSSSLRSRPTKPILWIKVLLDSGLQNESVEPLIDFLAILVSKLWPNFRILIKEIPENYLPNSCNIWNFWHNFGIRNARKSIKGSKDSYYSLESNITLSHNIGSLDRPMTSSK